MSKAPRSLPDQEPLPIADRTPAQAPEVQVPTGLDQQQTDEFDRIDAQGRTNSRQTLQEVGATALIEEPSKFIEFKENGVDVAIPRDIALGLRSGKPAEPKAFKPKSRRGLSGKQRLTADGPTVPQPPYN